MLGEKPSVARYGHFWHESLWRVNSAPCVNPDSLLFRGAWLVYSLSPSRPSSPLSSRSMGGSWNTAWARQGCVSVTFLALGKPGPGVLLCPCFARRGLTAGPIGMSSSAPAHLSKLRPESLISASSAGHKRPRIHPPTATKSHQDITQPNQRCCPRAGSAGHATA